MSIEQKLDAHIDEDHRSFERLFVKLDSMESKLDMIRGQWKLVGGILGALVGVVGAWLLG